MSSATIQHIAIIPDGNRRWARLHNLPISKGHEAGFQALKTLLQECKDLGPKVLSFYAFSTENFNRDSNEVQQLFYLLESVLQQFSKELKKNNIQLRISGSRENLPNNLIKQLDKALSLCSEGEFILNICFNYGSQEEFINITKKIAEDCVSGKTQISEITKQHIESYLWNSDLPPVDLMIRSSGEYRISNFMLWQCAYAEFYFTSKLWPDFSSDDFKNAIQEFQQRHRRYGT